MKGYDIHKNLPKSQKEVLGMTIGGPLGHASNLMMMLELRKKISIFRDIIDLPPCDGSTSINEVSSPTTLLQLNICSNNTSFMFGYILFVLELFVFWQLVMGTIEDLHELYPEIIPSNWPSEIKGTSIDQVYNLNPPRIGLSYLFGC